ncbi:MAG: hypothetical protein B7X06_03130, partial [Verrucomicrobia bacterium 21-51-4]
SNNLITTNKPKPLGSTESAQDAACISVLEQLLSDPNYQTPALQKALKARIEQLKEFRESYIRGAQQSQERGDPS